MKIDIPGREALEIENLLLDFNGTLTQVGETTEMAKLLLGKLSRTLKICIATSDTRGNADDVCSGLPVEILPLPQGKPADEAKLTLLRTLGSNKTCAIGNGRNDALMLAEAALGICILGEEGAQTKTLAAAEIVVHSIADALIMFVETDRLVAILRN